MSDPYENYVVFLSHFDGNNGDNIVFDNNVVQIYSAGTAPKLSTTQSKFGSTSCAFIGTGSLYVNTSGFNFGSSNITIEGFVYPTGSGSPFLDCQTSANLMSFYCDTSTSARLILNNANLVSGITLTANTWQHIAIVRNGNTWTVYVNGVSAGSGTNSNSFDCSVSGIGGSSSGAIHCFSGYVDELRVTKGIARYTSDFTPPSQAFDNVTRNYFFPDATILTCNPADYSGFTVGRKIDEPFRTAPSYYDGGTYYIDDYLVYNASPAAREVCLFTKKDKRLIATTWSDATTGYYKFDRLKYQEYFCVAFDYLKLFDNVSHDLILEGP